MSDRITVFNQGIIRLIDSPEALYERPASSFVAGLIGENNGSHGTVESVNGERCRVLLDSGAKVTATALPSGGVPRRLHPKGAPGPDGRVNTQKSSARTLRPQPRKKLKTGASLQAARARAPTPAEPDTLLALKSLIARRKTWPAFPSPIGEPLCAAADISSDGRRGAIPGMSAD